VSSFPIIAAEESVRFRWGGIVRRFVRFALPALLTLAALSSLVLSAAVEFIGPH
jgi:hypothetical protein